MSFLVLVSPRPSVPPTTPPAPDVLMWLESWDGTQRVDLSSGPVRWRAGAVGLEAPPVTTYRSSSPGMPGSIVTDVSTTDRPVLLPVTIGGRTWTETWDAIQQLRDITDPTNGVGPDGNFRLVATSKRGTRQLGMVYQGGLEGDGQPSQVRQNRVLDLAAPQPFAEDREEQTRPFRLVADATPFLGGIWGEIYLTSSRIASGETPIQMASAVPVYPTIEITGPADSVLITAGNGLRIEVPDGVPSGSTLRIVTDPRRTSRRLFDDSDPEDVGEPAASMLALGSQLEPFGLGTTQVDVSAPGATADTLLRLTWRGLHRGLW
jgi:hypothetical protein